MSVAQPVIQDGPAACRHCGHEFKSFLIKIVDGRQVLIDLDGDLVFELEKTCHYCHSVFSWHSSYKTMRDNSKAFHRLMASVDAMHKNQSALDEEVEK